jgi:tetratricopeptide (TPR) repeat protein
MEDGLDLPPAGARGLHEIPRSRSWRVAGICAVLVTLVFIVFGQTVSHGFVNFDDNYYVYENPMVLRGLSFDGFRWALTFGQIGHWHPLTWVTHMLDCQLYGMWAGGHHLTNVILHAVAVVLLFLVLLQMTGALWRCAFVAAAWAIHPLRVESVAWIAERKDVLSAVFFMLTLGAYVRYVRKPSTSRYLLIVIAFALGLMSKNMLITLPFLLLLLDYWPLRRLNEPSQLYQRLREKLPLFALSAISCVITFLVPEKLISTYDLPLWLRVENAFVSYCIYLWQTIWPAGLAPFYPNPTHAFPLWEVVGSFALLCVVSAAAFRVRKTYPWLLIGWLWFVGMLVPVIGLVQISSYSHADRYTYLPQIGLCFAGTWMAADWAGQQRERRFTLGSVALVILCALLIAGWRQTAYWRDNETLWAHALECTRDNWAAHNDLGTALFKKGRIDEAIAQFREAVRINPDDGEAHNNLGSALFQNGSAEEAIAQFREAVRINPAIADAYSNLGIALYQLGRTEEAVAQYREALKIDPTNAEAHCNLGVVMFHQGHIREAMAQYLEALRTNPAYADAHYNLGNALFQQGRTEEAMAEFREALRINPAHADAHYNLGNALLQQGRAEEAMAQYRQALEIDPSDAEAHGNLGVTLLQQGRMEEAIAELREAVRINPRYAEAHYNLGNALLREGQTAGAITQIGKALELQPANLTIENTLAWILATASQPSLRNGARAVQMAGQASQGSGGNNPGILRTLAAAYAEAGQFPNAVQTARKALQLVQSDTNLAGELKREINLYEAGQPFREGK